MNKNRTLTWAAIGAIVAVLLVFLGHILDLRQPRLALEQQIAYNWLTLLLSPAAFLLRLTRPDDFIVPSFPFAVLAVVLNAMWYLVARKTWLALRSVSREAIAEEPQLAVAGSQNLRSSRRVALAHERGLAESSEAVLSEDFAETLSK